MHDLKNANMNGLEDISEQEMIDIQKYAQSIANMIEVALETKSIPTGGIYWRAAKILSTCDNYLNAHEDIEHANFIRKTHGVLADAELLDMLSEADND